MNRKQLLTIYLNLQGRMQKKSTTFFIGFQEKDWKILQNGTKIGYKNLNDPFYLPEKTYKLTDVHTQQVEEECTFMMHTPSRVYELRAATEELRKVWMRAITALKKEIKKKSRQEIEQKKVKPVNIVNNHNDSTLPSIDPFHQLNTTSSNLRQTVPPRFTYGTTSKLSSQLYGSKSMIEDQLKEKFKDYLKKMAPCYVHYHVFIAKLTTKSKELFMTNSASHYYILFSSKSLIPEEYISQENLTSAQLPHWADPDQFYRLSDDKNSCKSIFHMNMINEIIEADSTSSIKIIILGQTFQFFCDSLVGVKKMKEAMEVGRINALESQEGDSKKNYDNLILLHTSNLELFNEKVNQMIAHFQPDGKDYQPQVVKKFIENISPIIIEVLEILQNKVKIPTNTIIQFVRIIHDQVRKHLKLMWITSYQKVKGGDILNILKSFSRYQSLVNKYVKDLEMDDALKELSKFYMRICYKNFESIILGIVTQQKKDNYFIEGQQGSEPYYETHGVTDLFKFIYDVFQIAIPCWNNKLHLHNINRLIKRALAVFIKELKATVDEEDISTNELVAIANNYLKFNEEVQEFYDSKLSQLKQQTKISYDELRDDYREISMIVIDKLVLPLKLQLKIYFEKQNFYTASMEEAYKKIVESKIRENTKYAHFIFKKRYFQRIFSTIREEICKMLEKEAKKLGKKKPQVSIFIIELNKVIERIELYKKDCVDMAEHLVKYKFKLSKEFDELRMLLTSSQKEEVKMILIQSSEFFKRVYKNILFFRADYVQGSPLHIYINSLEEEASKELKTPQDKDRRRSSFSKYYIQEWDRNSITSSIEKDKMGEKEKSQMGEEKIKMISQGYVRRVKNGSSEEIYLKLKQSVLYIYENDRMQRCQNTIQIQDINEVTMPSPEKPLFVIIFSALNRSKQMRIRCQTLEQCNRWVYSLQLQLRRISNDKKIKSKGIKIKDKKSKLIIDFDEVERGKTDYFSYNL